MNSWSFSASFARDCACLLGLVSVIIDGTLTARKEYEYIWRNPWSKVKLLYLLSRYGAVVVQATAYAAISAPSLLANPKHCLKWIMFQHLSFSLLYYILEVILMLRVYALYNKSVGIATLFSLCSLAEVALAVYASVAVIPGIVWDEKCIVQEAPMEVAAFGVVVLCNQTLIGSLTLWKYRHAIKDGWANIPVVRLVMRDGVYMFFAVTAIFAATIPYSLFVEQMSHIFFSMLITIMSVSACRLILNMQSLGAPSTPNDISYDESIGLSTIIDSFVSDDSGSDVSSVVSPSVRDSIDRVIV